MTPKNLFNIILKIFGLFFLREIIYIIPQLISAIPSFTKADDFGGGQSIMEILPLIVTLIAIAFYVFIIYQLLFNTNRIIDKLKLEQGFNQQEFSFNISTSLILTISLIVIGGVILTNEIPNFCRNIFSYFQEKNFTHGMTKPNYSYIVISGVKIIIGLLIIGERKRIVEFVVRRQGKKVEEIEIE
jgi:NADH:ubiquinone oxidoreductase subunit 5 (subunit L)/multisubunit Na+/H+ antiporter MnhA subunit